MAQTTGRVIRLQWLAEIVCVWVGSSTNSATLLFLQFGASDNDFQLQTKAVLCDTLATAQAAGVAVSVGHGDNDSAITSVASLSTEIALIGPAIHGDFLSVSGTGFPDDAVVVFDVGPLQITVTPDLRRPHWLLIARLPAVLPGGPSRLSVRGSGYQSGSIPVSVSTGAPLVRRVLYSGRPASGAYTVAFAATPGRATTAGVVSDGILSDRPAFHDHVAHCLRTLLTLDESLLRTDNMERAMRFVSIFDATRRADTDTALLAEVDPNLLEPQRDRVGPYSRAYWERVDVLYCISASATHNRASAWWGVDDASRTAASYTYDGTARDHGLYAQRPGCIAQSTTMDTSGLTAIHEFGHAASDQDRGMVIDLYIDDTRTGFVVNKKMRAADTDPVPANFGSMNTTTYAADAARDGIGYAAGWRSFHPALQVTNRPNMMDNYWLAGANRLQCRLDGLTFDWFHRRLSAKVGRPE